MKVRFALLLPIMLAACQPEGSAPADVNTDVNTSIEPLTIVSTNPLNGAADVDVDADIQVTFSKSIDFANLDVSQVHLVSDITGVEVPGLLDYDAQNFTLTFTPDYLLANDTQYHIQIDEGITDIDDQILGKVLHSFTTNDNYQFTLESSAEQCDTDCDCDYELWAWDEFGQARQLADINPDGSSFPSDYDYVRYKGLYYFSAKTEEHGDELWVTDGTKGFTQLFMDLRAGSPSSNPFDFIVFNDLLYFVATAADGFQYIWRTDGTPEGTKTIANNLDNAANHSFADLTVLGDRLIYVVSGLSETIDGVRFGKEVFATDGTDDVNYLIYDLNPGSGLSGARSFVELNDQLYFSASDGSAQHSYSLFTTDGSEGHMELVKDINPTENNNSEALITDLTKFNDRLLFTAVDGVNGRQLWVSDGTSDGTEILKILNIGATASIGHFAELNGLLYFNELVNDGLWVTDGTEAGTQLIKDFDEINSIESIGATLVFSAALGDSEGLWTSDGSEAGTQHYYPMTNVPYLFEPLVGSVRFYDYDDPTTPFYYTDGTFNGTFQWLSENGLPFISDDT